MEWLIIFEGITLSILFSFVSYYNGWSLHLCACIIIFICCISRIILKYFKRRRLSVKGDKNFFYRDIPCKNNIFLIYAIVADNIEVKEELEIRFINSVLVKWYREGIVDIKYNEEEKSYNIDFSKLHSFDTTVEQNLYYMLLSYSGPDRILKTSEFSGSVLISPTPKSQFDTYFCNYKKYIADDLKKLDVDIELKHIVGLLNYINTFSNLKDCTKDEVFLRDHYVLFAILFNLTDKIKCEFADLLPFSGISTSMFIPQEIMFLFTH